MEPKPVEASAIPAVERHERVASLAGAHSGKEGLVPRLTHLLFRMVARPRRLVLQVPSIRYRQARVSPKAACPSRAGGKAILVRPPLIFVSRHPDGSKQRRQNARAGLRIATMSNKSPID